MNSVQWNILYALRMEQSEWSDPQTAVERWGLTLEQGKTVQTWIQERINELEKLKKD
jgi:hypothetical protein